VVVSQQHLYDFRFPAHGMQLGEVSTGADLILVLNKKRILSAGFL
jgi:hypothetical protein